MGQRVTVHRESVTTGPYHGLYAWPVPKRSYQETSNHAAFSIQSTGPASLVDTVTETRKRPSPSGSRSIRHSASVGALRSNAGVWLRYVAAVVIRRPRWSSNEIATRASRIGLGGVSETTIRIESSTRKDEVARSPQNISSFVIMGSACLERAGLVFRSKEPSCSVCAADR